LTQIVSSDGKRLNSISRPPMAKDCESEQAITGWYIPFRFRGTLFRTGFPVLSE
jgi:hypothetical protein